MLSGAFFIKKYVYISIFQQVDGIRANYSGLLVSLSDICLKPLGDDCASQSILQVQPTNFQIIPVVLLNCVLRIINYLASIICKLYNQLAFLIQFYINLLFFFFWHTQKPSFDFLFCLYFILIVFSNGPWQLWQLRRCWACWVLFSGKLL